MDKLDQTIKNHENLIPTVMKTQVMVDLYWKCYAYGDELKPHIEFLDGIMMSSTREIAPSCVENVDELIERQEKALHQLDTKKHIVKDLIEKGKNLLLDPEKPKFLDSHVQKIVDGWDDTKLKAQERLNLLIATKAAWEGYAEGSEGILTEFEKAEEEMEKIKKELEALSEKMSILPKFEEKVAKIEDFCQNLECFDNTSKSLDDWMKRAATELDNIKNHSHQMVPEDRVAVCMELQEDIAAKVVLIEESIAQEQELLPQGDSVPKEAVAHKEELTRIHKFTLDLQVKVKLETANFSEDVKFWAEYRTGIKSFTPWLEAAETETADGLGKPGDLPQAS